MVAQTIPVLSLQQFTQGSETMRSRFVRDLGEALQSIGFFALEQHAVEARLIQTAYGAAEAFFALPDQAKQRYEVAELKGQRGFIRFGKEHAKDHPAPDLKEFWHMGREQMPPGYPPVLENLWPKEVPQFRAVMTELYQQLEACATVLLEACALFLELPPDFFQTEAIAGSSILRIIHYPPIPEAAPPESLRAAPHEDINLITLLCEATDAGLELLQSDGTWLPISTDPGQIIVDTGDMLQVLSNGLLKSTTHRVVNPQNVRSRRFSMPFFVHPRPQFDLTPLPACFTRTGGVPQFPSQTAEQYLDQRLREIGLA
ncbi:MAG: isopenicillin N synthase family oxygenase [Leptolyngbya sp. SIO4C1]|nr:isopenicillin N synthase family oxygenase [Leptolyngbya sp. SIO4C1]